MRPFFLPLLGGLLIGQAALAETAPPRNFGFRPLEIYKFKRGTSRLIVTDINRDGLDDILFANNYVSRLEILIRKPAPAKPVHLPQLEDSFEDRGIIVDQSLKAIRVSDLNNDSRPDILSFGSAIGLQVRYQLEDGTFGDPQRIFIKDPASVVTIQVGDLNEDALDDILVCRRDQAELLWNSVTRPFQQSKTLTFSNEKSYYGDLADINRDGLPDLAFHFNSSRNPLKVRFGRGDGSYGIEQPVDFPPRQYMNILQTEGQPPQVGMVLKNRLAFRLYDFTETAQPPLSSAQEVSPARIGLEGTNKKTEPQWVAADFNQDGFDDLLVAAPEISRLHLYRGTPEGLAPEPHPIDTLSEVARLSRFSNGDLLVVSKKEKTAAVHQAGKFEQFPAILKAPGDVLAGCALEAGSDCWLVCKKKDEDTQLVRINPKKGTPAAYPLKLENDPTDLLAFSLPGRKTGLILFMPYDTPVMRIFDGRKLTPLTSESFRALSQMLTRSNVHLKTAGHGDSLIISQGAIARQFDWKGDRYEITRQFNPENPRSELVAACRYTLLDGSSGTLLYDRSSADLIRFAADGDAWGKIHIPDADQTIFDLVQLKNPDRDTLVLLDRGGLNRILGNGTRLTVTSTAEYVSPSDEPKLAYVKSVRLGSPPRPMMALVDPANRAIELVSRNGDKLHNELAFEVFLVSGFADQRSSRGTEPHDLESGDINGDGIGDLAVLSQDKLLIYLGE